MSIFDQAQDQVWERLQQIAAGLGASGQILAHALQDLPTTTQELARELPQVTERIRRAGLRIGEPPHTDADIMALFDQIPGPAKLGIDEAKIYQFLSDKHASHILSRKNGGSSRADNLLWELGIWNMARGSRNMTVGEQLVIRVYNAVDALCANSATLARLGLTSLGMAVITQACVTAISHTLDLQRGEITIEEFRDHVLQAAKDAGITTAIFFPLLIAVIALLPELTILLTLPSVVLGFNALFGLSVAVPIIQSILRHLEADGFGAEAALYYRSLLGTHFTTENAPG